MQDVLNTRTFLIVSYVTSYDNYPNFGFFQIVMSFVLESQQHPVQIVINII